MANLLCLVASCKDSIYQKIYASRHIHTEVIPHGRQNKHCLPFSVLDTEQFLSVILNKISDTSLHVSYAYSQMSAASTPEKMFLFLPQCECRSAPMTIRHHWFSVCPVFALLH